MEDHKSEIENWDLGAGIYVSFYSIRSSLPDANNIMNELVKKLVLGSVW
jgi:nuclear pore complex protein Nup98-Nup96